MNIIISPYAQKLPPDKASYNPKNFPYWDETLRLVKLKLPDLKIIQVGGGNEPVLDRVTETFFNSTPAELLQVAKNCDAWISVDSFFQHFCAYYKIPNGVVIFGQSDPKIFGYPHNRNLLKDQKHLRQDQFKHWWETPNKLEVFVDAETVAKTLFEVLKVD